VRVPRAWLEAFRRDTDPTEPIADDGGTVWDMFCHEASAMLAASTPVGGWEDISTLAHQMMAAIGAMAAVVDGLPEDVCELHADNLNALSDALDAVNLTDLRAALAAPPPPSVSIDNGSRPQEAVPGEQAERAVLANLTHAAAALVKCHDIFMRAQGGVSGNQADGYNLVASKWTEWARLRGALEPAMLHLIDTAPTPQPADGCSSNEGAGQ